MIDKVCPLCQSILEESILWQDAHLRVVYVDHPLFPGFCRVIWHEHITEMSDLSTTQQRHLMETVLTIERILRVLLQPKKINLASLGNQVPHLHWHIIPRFTWDSHFPEAIWANPKREVDVDKLAIIKSRLHTLPMVLNSTLISVHT